MLFNQLDNTDLNIIRELQENSRIPNAELATRVGLSPSACLSRMNRLRETGVIKQFVSILDRLKLGLSVLTFTFVTLYPHTREVADTFVEKITKMDRVLECYHITGSFDFLLKIVSTNISSYRDYILDEILEIPGVERVETLVVLKEEKQSFRLPLDSIQDNTKSRGEIDGTD